MSGRSVWSMISRTMPVTALFLVVNEGSDPPMMEVLGLKASEAQQIMDPTLGVQAADVDGARLRGLVERYLDHRAKPKPPEAPAPKPVPAPDRQALLFAEERT